MIHGWLGRVNVDSTLKVKKNGVDPQTLQTLQFEHGGFAGYVKITRDSCVARIPLSRALTPKLWEKVTKHGSRDEKSLVKILLKRKNFPTPGWELEHFVAEYRWFMDTFAKKAEN